MMFDGRWARAGASRHVMAVAVMTLYGRRHHSDDVGLDLRPGRPESYVTNVPFAGSVTTSPRWRSSSTARRAVPTAT